MAELADYKVVLYRQNDGSWAAYVPALPGCHAVMATRESVLVELEHVFAMIREELEQEGAGLPADVESLHAGSPRV